MRVMKDGHALCVNFGKEPEQKSAKTEIKEEKSNSTLKNTGRKTWKIIYSAWEWKRTGKTTRTDKIHRFTSKSYSEIKVKLKKFLSLPFCFQY